MLLGSLGYAKSVPLMHLALHLPNVVSVISFSHVPIFVGLNLFKMIFNALKKIPLIEVLVEFQEGTKLDMSILFSIFNGRLYNCYYYF